MTPTPKTVSIKQQARKLIQQLPDDCTIEDIHYQLFLVDKIQRSEESFKQQGGISHEDVKKQVASWLTR